MALLLVGLSPGEATPLVATPLAASTPVEGGAAPAASQRREKYYKRLGPPLSALKGCQVGRCSRPKPQKTQV
ncbi:unnamed protein product [Boreogadus saida]